MNNPRLVVVFYGRFQPCHVGHYGVYKNLTQVFGSQNVYVATSNKTDGDKSPLNFKTKKKLLSAIGIPSNKIIQSYQNYNSKEIEHELGVKPKNSVFIVAIGAKDADRLKRSDYFKKYTKGGQLESMVDRAYYYIIPNITMGSEVLSATAIRSVLKKKKLSIKDYSFLKKTMNADQKLVDQIKPLFENRIISEGGNAGHMAHPYEDKGMRFSEMQKMIDLALSGELSKQEVTEKVDGQNLFGSIINGQLRLARNKTTIRDRGKQSMTIHDMAMKWKDKPDIATAFTEGAKTLEGVLLKLPKASLKQIFDNGRNWINFEVIWSVNKNVIDYDQDVIIMHNVNVVNDDGNNAGLNSEAQELLFAKIHQFNSIHKSNVVPPIMMRINKAEDFSKKRAYFSAKLNAFRSRQKVGPSATLGDWMDSFWKKKISILEKDLGHKLNSQTRNKIVNRLTNFDSSYSLNNMKKDIGYAPMYEAIKGLDSQNAAISKDATMPLELLFLELGAEVLQNIEKFLTANPDKTLDGLRRDIAAKISQIHSSNNVEDLEKMRESLKKIQAIGGLDRLVPSEGIVFKFNGRVYKLTGLYAPINQLMGLGRFER